MNVSRRSPGLFVVMIAVALGAVTARSSAFWRVNVATGGLMESATDSNSRDRLSRDQLAAFLPAHRGPFTFPAPYNTKGFRLTEAADCGGADCVAPPAGPSQRILSNSTGSSTLYSVITLRQGDAGTTLFSIDKNTGAVARLGPAFGPGNPLNQSAGDSFSFSATLPTALYGHDGIRLVRHDIVTHVETTVIDMTSAPAVAAFGSGRRLGHLTTDNSDAIHAFVVQNALGASALGCGVYREASSEYSYFPSTVAFDDCQIDKSGRYLIVTEGDQTRVIDLQTAAEMALIGGSTGSIGRGDTGFGYTVNEDNRGPASAAMTRWFLDRPFSDPSQRSVQHLATEWAEQVTVFTHGNAVAADPASQYGCSVTTYLRRPTPVPREGELVCYPLDGSLRVLVVAPAMTDIGGPGGRTVAERWTTPVLDPTGEFLLWTSNLEGSGRLDAFVVQVPASLLDATPPATDIIAPEVHLVNPERFATVSGTIQLQADASDNVNVTALHFAVDGVTLPGPLDEEAFALQLDTTTLPDGVHLITATAADAAGNTATTPAGLITVMNTATGPQISTIADPVVSQQSAVIEWTTSQLASSQVDFGVSTAYDNTAGDGSDVSWRHLIVLTGLSPGTTYHYRLKSVNANGTITSDDLSLSTDAMPSDPSPLPGRLNDGLSYPPPSTGGFAYNSFAPAVVPGTTYADPVFGTTVRRLTVDHEADDIYARNMWWNADGTKYLHGGKVIDTATGQMTHEVPRGSATSDAGFDPVDPDVLYYYLENAIHRVTLSKTSAQTSDSIFFEAPGELLTLGGTINWFDASGRYFLVRYGPEPSVHLYDRLNIAAGPYANPVNASLNIDTGSYVGLTPDGQFLVGYETGSGSLGKAVSWKIDHGARTVGTANYFWSLCGDHGSFLSASDGRNYMVVAACMDVPEIWRVDITNNADGLNETQQKALPHNQRLIRWPTWDDEVHFSTVARGPFRDWAFISTEDASDTFNTGVDAGGVIAPWRPYKQEIVAFNVLTGEMRRLAHHRSRSTDTEYAYMPRLSASWAGEMVGWSSNFNDPAAVDIMALAFAAAPPSFSGVTVSAITGTAATISWSTNQSATTQVEYGLTSSYGNTTTVDSTLTNSHSQLLAGLAIGTTYHYRVISTNSVGLTARSDDSTFTTVAPPAIFEVAVKALTGTSAAVQWTTDQPSDSRIEYGLTTGYGSTTALSSALVTNHTKPITGLTPGATYHYRVISTNSAGLTAASADSTFTTVGVPVLSDVTATAITGTTVTITWTTSQPTTSQVQFGLTSDYGTETAADSTLATTHAQTLTGLQPGTTYHFRVLSTNSVDLTATSEDFTFASIAVPMLSGITVSGITGTAATISWMSDQPTDSTIEYGLTPSYGSATGDSALVTEHHVALTGLASGTTYHFRITSTNSVALTATSGDATFTTVAPPVLSDITSSAVTGTAANISWTTDQAASTQVEYGVTPEFGSSTNVNLALVTAHGQALTNLTPGTAYFYRVHSTNGVGLTTTSGTETFTTVAVPITSAVTASGITGSSVEISWTTDQQTDAQVEYGTTTAYGSNTAVDPTPATSHVMALVELTPGTTYHYRVKSTNSVGLTAASNDFTFTTVAPPVITSVAALGATGTTVTIGWTTDQPSNSLVEFGPTSAYGGTSPFDASPVTSHAQLLSGLTPGGLYHFRVRSTNAVGLETVSADDTFTLVAPPIVSHVTVTNVTGSSATFTWTTDQPTDAQIEYGPTSTFGSLSQLGAVLATSHTQSLTDLSPGTTYHFRVRSTNDVGLTAVSADGRFTTAAAPVISAVAASLITGTTATVTWSTDQPSTSRVEYGVTTSYGESTVLETTLDTEHSQTLAGLSPGTTYHYRVTSTNEFGLTTTSTDGAFTTVAAPAISDVSVAVVTGTAAAISWTTNQPATSQIEFGPTTSYGSVTALDSALVTSHGHTISGLAPGTTFHFRVRSVNVHGTVAVSDDGIFTTIAPPALSAVTVSNVTPTSATFAWTTSQPTDAQVEYGPTTAYGTTTAPQLALTTSHTVTVNGLAIGTTYHYRVLSTNAAGLLSFSADAVLATVASPSIAGVATTAVTQASAAIVWSTSQPTDSVIEYGLTSNYGTTLVEPTAVTSHAVAFSGLSADTTYHYRVTSRNSFGLSAESGDLTFKTEAAAQDAPVVLTILKSGSGTVKGPGALDCGSACSAEFASGTLVTLVATPAPGSTFAGWSGACSTVQTACTLTITDATSVTASFSKATAGDFDGDGFADLIWQHGDGTLALWTMQGTSRLSAQFITPLRRSESGGVQLNAMPALTSDSRVLDPDWHIVATPDLDGNGRADLLWQHEVSGELAAWIMERHIRLRAEVLTPGAIDPSWHLQASSDMNADGQADLVWHQNGTNLLAVWFMSGTTRIGEQVLSPATVPAEWRLVGSADFDLDGQLDLVWQSQTTGDAFLWYMNGTALRSEQPIGRFGDGWEARAVGDFDRDGHPDVIWQKATGELAVWFMNGTVVVTALPLSPDLVSAGWRIVGAR